MKVYEQRPGPYQACGRCGKSFRSGLLRVQDPDTQWRNQGLGEGSNVYIGGSGNTGKIEVLSGAEFINEGMIYVGDSGNGDPSIPSIGELFIQGGGKVNNHFGDIGRGKSAIGIVTVDGIGSEWNISGTLIVGDEGSGILNIQNDGTVTVGENATIENAPESEGTLTFGIGQNGPGLLDVGGDLIIGGDSTLLVTVESSVPINVGDQFTVVTFDGSISGTFTRKTIPRHAYQ